MEAQKLHRGHKDANKDWNASYLLRAWKAPTRCLKASWGAVLRKAYWHDSQMRSSSYLFTLSTIFFFLAVQCIRLYCEQSNWNWGGGEKESKWTHCPLEEWINRVMSVEVPGHTQFKASMAYLNSSSHTTWSASIGHKWPKPHMQTTITLRSIKLPLTTANADVLPEKEAWPQTVSAWVTLMVSLL